MVLFSSDSVPSQFPALFEPVSDLTQYIERQKKVLARSKDRQERASNARRRNTVAGPLSSKTVVYPDDEEERYSQSEREDEDLMWPHFSLMSSEKDGCGAPGEKAELAAAKAGRQTAVSPIKIVELQANVLSGSSLKRCRTVLNPRRHTDPQPAQAMPPTTTPRRSPRTAKNTPETTPTKKPLLPGKPQSVRRTKSLRATSGRETGGLRDAPVSVGRFVSVLPPIGLFFHPLVSNPPIDDEEFAEGGPAPSSDADSDATAITVASTLSTVALSSDADSDTTATTVTSTLSTAAQRMMLMHEYFLPAPPEEVSSTPFIDKPNC